MLLVWFARKLVGWVGWLMPSSSGNLPPLYILSKPYDAIKCPCNIASGRTVLLLPPKMFVRRLVNVVMEGLGEERAASDGEPLTSRLGFSDVS